MAEHTAIEWCDATFNPWIGCTRVSPACDDCYAARSTPARTLGVVWGSHDPRRRTSGANWKLPLRWEAQHEAFQAEHGRRRRVFCASLADVFDNQVPGEWREDLFELIRTTPHLDWLLLTKRPQNIVRMVREHGAIAGNGMRYLPDNVALGTTAEDQQRAELNLPHLLDTKVELGARRLFVSVEPMLGPVDLTRVIHPKFKQRDDIDPFVAYDTLRGHMVGPDDVGLPRLDWVICGGESGPKARPMHPNWARSLRDQCAAAGVPFMLKQWGEWGDVCRPPVHDSFRWPQALIEVDPTFSFRVGKKAAGRLLDGVQHDGFPEIK